MSFLSPQLFDALVYIIIAVGLVLAAIRIYGDFKRGPRWPDEEPIIDQTVIDQAMKQSDLSAYKQSTDEKK